MVDRLGRNVRSPTHPTAGTHARWTKQPFDSPPELRRQPPQILKRSQTCESDLERIALIFGPGPIELADRGLGGVIKAHLRKNQNVIDSIVMTQRQGDCMDMLMPGLERLTIFIFTSEFWTVDPMTLAQLAN